MLLGNGSLDFSFLVEIKVFSTKPPQKVKNFWRGVNSNQAMGPLDPHGSAGDLQALCFSRARLSIGSACALERKGARNPNLLRSLEVFGFVLGSSHFLGLDHFGGKQTVWGLLLAILLRNSGLSRSELPGVLVRVTAVSVATSK